MSDSASPNGDRKENPAMVVPTHGRGRLLSSGVKGNRVGRAHSRPSFAPRVAATSTNATVPETHRKVQRERHRG
jgi:hypothetical protein